MPRSIGRRRPFHTGTQVEMVALLVGAALAAFTIAVVAYPFLRSRLRSVRSRPPTEARLATPELENIYDAVRTLQLEFQLGRVPENLYQEQLQSYRLQAAAALRQEMTEQTGAMDRLLEQEVLVARAALRSTNGGPGPCPNCGSSPGAEMTTCPECGASLKPT